MASYYFVKTNETVFVPQSKLLNMTLAFRKELQPHFVKPVPMKPVFQSKKLIDLTKAVFVRTEKQAWDIIESTFNKHKDKLKLDTKKTWNIRWAKGSMKKSGGNCRPGIGQIRIALLFAVKVPEAILIDTVLHEIAHGLAKPKCQADYAPHGALWKQKAKEIGCSGNVTHNYLF